MPARIRGDFENIRARLTQTGGRIVKSINDQLEREAKGIQELARDYVPIDEGNMEAAIKIESKNRRQLWAVYVDKNMPDDTGKYTVGDYLNFLHEGIPDYSLGPKSLAKAAQGKAVGRKFLERAYRERVAGGMLGRVRDAARLAGVL
jgi:hypothetical protein